MLLAVVSAGGNGGVKLESNWSQIATGVNWSQIGVELESNYSSGANYGVKLFLELNYGVELHDGSRISSCRRRINSAHYVTQGRRFNKCGSTIIIFN